MIVPQLWWHTTANTGEAVAIGAQKTFIEPNIPDSLLRSYAACATWITRGPRDPFLPDLPLDKRERTVELEPLNLKHRINLFHLYLDLGMINEALNLMIEGARLWANTWRASLVKDKRTIADVIGRFGGELDKRLKPGQEHVPVPVPSKAYDRARKKIVKMFDQFADQIRVEL